MITGAQAMIKCLENEGVQVMFGYPGAAICPFYDELQYSDIRHVLVRQEQNAGHAASGYARTSGKVGVCVATSGPGALNVITAIATAYMDSIPIVIITGQVSTDQIGKDVFQEADITGAAEPFTKYSYLIRNVNEIPRIFAEAFYIAKTGRPGPVLIDVPFDVQLENFEFKPHKEINIKGYKPEIKTDEEQIKKAVIALQKAKTPVICAGGGIISGKAQNILKKISEKYSIPVVNTLMGKGVLSTNSKQSLGMMGMHGVKAAIVAISKADILIIAGARVGDRAYTAPGVLEKRTTIVHIDIDPAEIGKNVDAHIPVVGDVKDVLEKIYELLKPVDFSSWLDELCLLKTESFVEGEINSKFVNPKRFISLLSDRLPEESIYVADVGQNQIWSTNCFKVKNGKFLASGGMGTMGYSLGAAIGSKIAEPKTTVVAVCGDGSFQMMSMELATMVQHNAPVKLIIMKNTKLGMVRELQTMKYCGRLTCVSLDGSPDFIKLAESYGVQALRISSDTEIEKGLEFLLCDDSPAILECVVDSDECSL